jgi:hypothetical protein
VRDLAELGLQDFGRPAPRPAPGSSDFARLSQLIGAELPDAYVRLLEYRNGGAPMTNVFQCDGQEWDVNWFFHLSPPDSDADTESILWNYHHRWPGAPRAMLPIAGDSYANLICIDLGQEGAGRVLLWVHDDPRNPLRLVASDFAEFIDSLRPSTGE